MAYFRFPFSYFGYLFVLLLISFIDQNMNRLSFFTVIVDDADMCFSSHWYHLCYIRCMNCWLGNRNDSYKWTNVNNWVVHWSKCMQLMIIILILAYINKWVHLVGRIRRIRTRCSICKLIHYVLSPTVSTKSNKELNQICSIKKKTLEIVFQNQCTYIDVIGKIKLGDRIATIQIN